MCGIIGYVGHRNTPEILLSGLRRLEYRGYDSAGIALVAAGMAGLHVTKRAGRIDGLDAALRATPPALPTGALCAGIGHTRWATHGAPTEANAHPHVSQDGCFAIVHNGIIENYTALRDKLTARGYRFASETDSEVIAHLVQECFEGNLRGALAAAIDQMEGTYGIALISSHCPGMIVAARRGSPIAIGICDNETVIASDVSAIVSHTRQVIFLDDGDMVTATPNDVDIASIRNVPVTREMTHIDWDVGEIEKGGYAHFMLKEINEQPAALSNALRGRLVESEGTAKLSGMQMTAGEIAGIDRISIAACGTSYYAGMVGKYLFEEFADLPTEVEQAAEFRYRNPIVQRNTCLLAISQSGETADTLAAVREALRKGASVLGICNTVGSTIARETGRGIYLHAGPEIGVASTKAFTCQVAVLALMAIRLGRARRLAASEGARMVTELARLPELVQAVLDQDTQIAAVAEKYAGMENFFFIGRGYMFPCALEGALKLKEISYIHAEGYHAAELKHGPIALLEKNVPVVACAVDMPGKSKTISNMQECRARQAPVIAIATQGDEEIAPHCDEVLWIPRCAPFAAAIPTVVAEQLFAYHVARLRGCPIDKPRNLAKSVTVE